jgi:hypothetical protein
MTYRALRDASTDDLLRAVDEASALSYEEPVRS